MVKRIPIRGTLISNNDQEAYDYYGLEATSQKSIFDSLPDDGSDVVLEVNSNGGLVTAGSDIYTTLRNYSGKVTAEITGIAASAASVAVMGADKVVISPTAQIMVHKALYRSVSGNSDDLYKASSDLKASDQAIVNAYVAKTGLSEEEILDLMKNETFMSAQRAVELGFADEIMQFEYQAVADIGGGMLPKAVVDDYYNRKADRKREIEAMKRELEKQEILDSL